jgi:type IV secretion system protein VirB10
MIGPKRTDREPWTEEEEEPLPPPWYRHRRLIFLALGLAALLVFVFTRGANQAPQETTQAGAIGVSAPYTPVTPDPKPPVDTPPAPPITFPPNPMQQRPPGTQGAPTPPGTPGTPARTPGLVSYKVEPSSPPKNPTEPAEPAHTGIKFAATTLPGAKASPQIDDTYVLYPGLLLCVLDTAIDSNLPGPLMCHLPGTAYSRKGVPLMEAGTQVMGKYESLKHGGTERLEATNTVAFTPNGIWVPLSDSPMADDLGRTGLSGTVDRQYLERFAGAVLIDLGHAALNIAQSAVAKGGNTYLSFNSTEGLASRILESEVNRPPIFTKNAGAMIAIWITHPIIFNDSYRVTGAGR